MERKIVWRWVEGSWRLGPEGDMQGEVLTDYPEDGVVHAALSVEPYAEQHFRTVADAKRWLEACIREVWAARDEAA